MTAPFDRVLVANRGEIALRVIRACHELGIEAVAVYSDADAGARHVRAADEAFRLGPAASSESYLRGDLIIDVARRTGAQAIHPGYGFLSERAAFATACERAGLVFVGPDSSTIAALGDKLAARRAASDAGVPVVPGTMSPAAVSADAISSLLDDADRVGWPLLVKAAAGGGGRGMRRVDRRDDLAAALTAASAEAAASFGDGSVYLERFVEGGRHVEVQLLGDSHGALVSLGERDCSVQRRHQKLVEETPAPGMTPDERRRLHERAVNVARAVGLRGAATAEFLLAPDGETWFLEVNARLQVEHGVTELVTDVDLVHEQLRVAAGQPLGPRVISAAARAADPSRHAIEVRVGAEDPGEGFTPLPGVIADYVEPSGPGVRVDSWVERGTRVTSEYDSLLAKLLVVAEDRDAALARLRRALKEFRITGLQTTLPFHLWLAGSPEFAEAALRTDFVERHWRSEAIRAGVARRAALAAVHAFATQPASWAPRDLGAPSDRRWRLAARREATDRWP